MGLVAFTDEKSKTHRAQAAYYSGDVNATITLIAALGAGLKIRVLRYKLCVNGESNAFAHVYFQSVGSNVQISGTNFLGLGVGNAPGISGNYAKCGHFETAANEGLGIVFSSGSGTVGIDLTYSVEPIDSAYTP